jgi:pilus assembly protein Flp/PilA
MSLIYIRKSIDGKWHADCCILGAPATGWENRLTERTRMNTMLLKMYVKLQDLLSREEGQDLVEYALVVALIAFGAVAGMSTLAKAINNEFMSISSLLASSV